MSFENKRKLKLLFLKYNPFLFALNFTLMERFKSIYVIQIQKIEKIHASKYAKCLASIVIFYYHSLPPCQLVQIENLCNWYDFRSQCRLTNKLSSKRVYIGTVKNTIKQEGLHKEQLKITHIHFVALNSRVTVFIFKIFIFMMP